MEGIERIRQLAKDIKDKPLLKIINYLISRDDMNDKYLNEEKSLKQMVEFIRENAEKQAKNGMAMIEDEVVYGWAIHYFDETNENLNLSKSNNSNKKKSVATKQIDKTQNNKDKYSSEGQLTLFDFIE